MRDTVDRKVSFVLRRARARGQLVREVVRARGEDAAVDVVARAVLVGTALELETVARDLKMKLGKVLGEELDVVLREIERAAALRRTAVDALEHES